MAAVPKSTLITVEGLCVVTEEADEEGEPGADVLEEEFRLLLLLLLDANMVDRR
jgi:hypothetical protein